MTTDETVHPDETGDDDQRADDQRADDPYRWLGEQASRMRAYQEALGERLHGSLQLVDTASEPAPGTLTPLDLEGVRVITHKDLELALRDVPLPPPSAHAADVETPSTVTVFAVCPDCGEGTYLATALGAELRVGNGKRELRLTHSGSSAPHHHGQRAMRVASPDPEVEGQTSLADILSDEEPIDDEPQDDDEEDEEDVEEGHDE